MRWTVIAVLMLAGCQKVGPQGEFDQCRREAIFEQCLKLAPAGPQSAKYNDWAEVIDECQMAAQYHSYRHPSQIPAECRSSW